MLAGISSQAWSEWQVFWHLYGFGEKRMDVRFAQLMALIANLVRSSDSPGAGVDDFLPDEEYDGSDDDEEIDVELSGEVIDEDQLIFEAMYREATE
jgi:hypothetical protein